MHSKENINLKITSTHMSAYIVFKQLIERIVALIVFIFSLPILILIAFLIRMDSKGPIIFFQTRIGKDFIPFRFYKFRTMWNDAQRKYPKLYRYHYSKQEIRTIRFKIINDPRLTPFGRLLRKTSLDELPNLINVIKGEMSLIGPRPEIPQMIKYYTEPQMKKFSVKPGITGYAQVNGRGLLTFQETIKQDLNYIRDQGFSTDLKLLIKTVYIVLKGLGAF